MKILILTDGYHTSTCVTEYGVYIYGTLELLQMLAKPHTIEYEVKVIGYEETNNCETYERLDAGCFSEEDFNLLWDEASSDSHWRI